MAQEHEDVAHLIMDKVQKIEARHKRQGKAIEELHTLLSQAATLACHGGLLASDGPFVPMSGGGDKPDDD